VPAPLTCRQGRQSSELSCKRQEYRQSDKAAEEYKLFERVGLEYLLRAQVEAKSCHYADQQQADRLADRCVVSFLNHD